MGLHTTSCVTVTCDGCGETAPLYEDMGIAHYESPAQAKEQLVDDTADDLEYHWSVSDDLSFWHCPTCAAAAVCAAAGGHDWGGWDIYGPNAFRACRRGACQASERRPVEEVPL